MSNIVEIADKVLVLPSSNYDNVHGGNSPISNQYVDDGSISKASFAMPEALELIIGFFNMEKEDLFDESILSKVQSIYRISEKSDLPLDLFLAEMATRLGGRMSPDLLVKMYAYLTILAEEYTTESKLDILKRERRIYENISYPQR